MPFFNFMVVASITFAIAMGKVSADARNESLDKKDTNAVIESTQLDARTSSEIKP